MSSLIFWFVYFTLNDVCIVKAVFKMVLLLVVFVNKVCDFNGIEFTEKGVCRIVFATLNFSS